MDFTKKYYYLSLTFSILPTAIFIPLIICYTAFEELGNFDIIVPMTAFGIFILIGIVISVVLFFLSKRNNEKRNKKLWLSSLLLPPILYLSTLVIINKVWY